MRRHRLTRLESQAFQLSGTTLYRWRILGLRSVATVVRELEADRVVAWAQPNYLFMLQQNETRTEGDAAQYGLAKLRLPQAHALTKGDNVLVAVIDSAIDGNHPELAGSIAGTFDALSTTAIPHQHGTAIASLIAAHGKLMGSAPDAKILAVRAFDPKDAGAEGTTFNILKGLDWAAAKNARIINMSFAGPADPMLQEVLARANARGIVLIAAVGNAGPNSPPLYPGAGAGVIGVTATDADDKLMPQANRGPQVAVAAPGVEILAAAPDGKYQITSGTSVAAAHVSGVAALLLATKPKLTPAQVRGNIVRSAHRIPGTRNEVGAGVVDALAVVNPGAK